MENTIENKAKLFAQYYGQIIIRNHSGFGGKFKVTDLHFQDDEEYYLELTSLSDITADDSLECWNIQDSEVGRERPNFELYTAFKVKDFRSIPFTEYSMGVVDYLRSRGYALPYLGVSVEEQIKRGWIKLKTK